MKILLFLTLINSLWAKDISAVIPCRTWQSLIDRSVKISGDIPKVSSLSAQEKLHAITCLLKLEGNKAPARIGGQTAPNVSQFVPSVNVEIAALFYIRYVYYADWNHCDAIGLIDQQGRYNTRISVKKAYESYKQWLSVVSQIGIERSLELGLDPMDGCIVDEIRWTGQYEWEYLMERRLRKSQK